MEQQGFHVSGTLPPCCFTISKRGQEALAHKKPLQGFAAALEARGAHSATSIRFKEATQSHECQRP
ncbi:MAG: hypothetical protein LBJ59_00080 [Zoogloeaceae bacterium]|jgi:hypothetical protein|nr:hypothetical protein [Zoogloeaceae bacterium]